MDSILASIRKMVLGIPINSEDQDEKSAFDVDLIMHINTAFSVLTQLGAGPEGGFSISDESSKWSDYIADEKDAEMVKSYVYSKVKLIFDPPSSSAAIDLLERNVKELEWRICERYEEYDS